MDNLLNVVHRDELHTSMIGWANPLPTRTAIDIPFYDHMAISQWTSDVGGG
jgi:hypothetical protein